MVAKVEERQLRVYCPTHKISFEVPAGKRLLCESGGHALAENFPHETFWEYCCDCQTHWPSDMDKGGRAKEQCPVCSRPTTRRYVCDECKLSSYESDDPARRKLFRVGTNGAVEPSCPGCGKPAKLPLQEHTCEETEVTFKTPREKCPFCEEQLRRPVEARTFCHMCGTLAEPSDRFCKKCGRAVGAAVQAGQQPSPNPVTTPLSDPLPPPPQPDPYRDHAINDTTGETTIVAPPPPPVPVKSSTGKVLGVGVAVILGLFIFMFLLSRSSSVNNNNANANTNSGGTTTGSFKSRFDKALNANILFSPSSDGAADLYEAEAGRSSPSSDLKDAATRLQKKLEQEGSSAIRRYYTDADKVDWTYVSKIYRVLQKIAPNDKDYSANYSYSLGMAYLNSGDHTKARSNFEDALRTHPNWVMAYNGLGRVYVQNESPFQDESKAEEYYKKACEADTSFTWGCRNLAALYMKQGYWSLAEQYMAMALQRSPSRDTIKKDMRTICAKQGKSQDYSGFCSD